MLKKIGIKNFKSLKNVEFEIPEFAVLVGYNASGKTNFVKAINLASLLARGIQVEEALNNLDLLSKEVLFDITNPKINFELSLVINGEPVKYCFTIEQNVQDNSKYRVTEETLTNGIKGKVILKRTEEKISIGVGTEDENVLTEIQLSANQLALSVIKEPKLVSEVQKALSSIVVHSSDTESLRSPGTAANIGSGLNKNLTELLFELKEQSNDLYLKLLNELKSIIPNINMLDVVKAGENLLTTFREENLGERDFSVLSASEGNLRTIAILASVMGKVRPSSVLIDEIENSLHPQRIKSLMRFLEYISSIGDRRQQVMITTHSPVVLNYVRLDQVIYIYRLGGETMITNPYKNDKVLKLITGATGEGSKLGELFSTGVLEEIFSSI